MYFINEDYPFSNPDLYKKYWIKSLIIVNSGKKSTFFYSKRDIQLAILTAGERITMLQQEYGINLIGVDIKEKYLEISNWSLLEFAEFLIINQILEFTLNFDSIGHESIITYPVFSFEEDSEVVHFE